MGTICSHGVVTLGDDSSASPSSNGSSVTQTTSTKTIQNPDIWNPFQITRSEAEDLLSSSGPGSFVFSHDFASELFLSLSVGKYVCHHSVVTRQNEYYVGAKKFPTIGEVIEYFKDHPLGEMTLKQEFKKPPVVSSIIQVKQHPDFSFQSSVIPSTSENSSSDGDTKKSRLLLPHQAFKEKSPVQIRRPPSQRTPVERIIEEESKNCDEKDVVVEERVQNGTKNKVTLQIPKNKVAPLPKKTLLRSGAIDQPETSSSGVDREVPSSISLMPIIPQQDFGTNSTQLYS